MTQELKEHLDNATPEQLEEDWKELEKLSEVGPIADEYVKQCKEDNKVMGSRIDFSLIERIELDLGDTHEVVVENGKTYVVKKKPKYPKDYEECCDILGRIYPITDDVEGYKWELIMKFQRLIVCRDAYLKIAGYQMGLDKPWEPDWSISGDIKYVIEVYRNNVRTNSQGYSNTILAFPTPEMRDAFCENFRELIKNCKELL